MSKTIFVTGASTGLGRATAILFAQHGWKVIATMRKPEQERELGTMAGIQLLPLDVTDLAQIEEAARRALAMGRVDVVFNNAGYGLFGPFEAATDEQLQRQLDTNLLGVMRVTKAFIPSFRERREGIFIATSSIGGHFTFPFNSPYHATKWALEGWSESLAFELGQFGIRVKTVAPGGIKTDFVTRSLVLTEHPAYAKLVERVLSVITDPKRTQRQSSAEHIAEVVYVAATDGKSKVGYLAGSDAKLIYWMRAIIGVEGSRKLIRRTFFGPG
jgi:NAD(P)-dependent dehydrogenase (short-subunit alcohol dehydrogenase family)